MKKTIRLATVFSGIGAVEQALKKLNVDFKIVFACDNGEREIRESKEEILEYSKKNNFSPQQLQDYVKQKYNSINKENKMKKSYFANYDISEEKWYEDIRFIDGNEYRNKVDLLVGGSPCQSFSNIGKRGGLEDARGTLFYDYARLIKEIKPTVFIYENVTGMLNHDKGETWKTIQSIFKSLGYYLHTQVLNAKDYGIPQNRKRLFVVGFKKDRDFNFPQPIILETKASDYFEENIPSKYYLGKKGFEFVTNPKYFNRARVNCDIIRTQKANQQFNWNGDFYLVPYEKIKDNFEILKRAHIDYYKNQKGAIRQLTPRECLRLMGFSDSYKIVVNDVTAYRQAGNSIVVNVLENILISIFKVEHFDDSINIATVFSGIGAAEFALKRLGVNTNIVFACDNGEREIDYNIEEERAKVFSLKTIAEKKEYVDNLYDSKTRCSNYVKKSYLANYECDENNFFQDVVLLDGKDFENKVDIFIGGSPCQSFSSVGFKGGLEDARGTLFYEYARLVKEIQPKVFIYENVRNLLKHDNGNTWKKIKEIFDSLNYHYKFAIMNSCEYGIPQNRRRLFVVGFKENIDFEFPPKTKELKYKMKDFTINMCDEGFFNYNSDGDLVLTNKIGKVDDRYTLSPKLYNYVMSPGTKTWFQKPKINMDIARTLLKTMGNRHRAGVDNYISFDGTDNLGSVRMLTEREAHRLMGFTDDYKIVVSTAQAYKQAGNSIVVDVMMEIFKIILKYI